MVKTKSRNIFLSIFIVFAMILQMLPMTAIPVYAESTNKITEIWVGSYKIWDGTTFDRGDYLAGKISYDDATYTLKLSDGFFSNGAYVKEVIGGEGTYYQGNIIRIVSTGKDSGALPIEFNIEIEGNVTIDSSTSKPYDEPYGEPVHGSDIQLDIIELTGNDANANLNITGDGTLNIKMVEGHKFRSLISVYTGSFGSAGKGNFTMKSGTLNIDTSNGVSDNTKGVGIVANVATFEGNSNTTINIEDNTGTTGIGVNTLVVKDTANLTVNGSSKTVAGASEPQHAIDARIFQTGGTITAIAGKFSVPNSETVNSRAVRGQLFLSDGTFIADSTNTYTPRSYEAFSVKPMIYGTATIEAGDDSSNLATVEESSDYQENHYAKITSTSPGTESGLTITDTEHVFPNIRSDTINADYPKTIYMLNFGDKTYTNIKVELKGANTDKFTLKTFGGFSSTLSPNDTTGFSVSPNLTGGKVDGTYTATAEITADELLTPLSCNFSYEVMTRDQDIIRTALSSVTDGSLSLAYGADKVDAVQNYVDNKLYALIDPYNGVTTTVTHVSDDTYSVEGSYGSETYTKNITMNITVAEAEKYTISFEAFPSEATKTGTLDPVQATQAVNITLPTAELANKVFTPLKDTKTFDKWQIGAGLHADLVEGGGTYIFTSNTTVYPTWRDLYDYSITFNGNGGTDSMTAICVKENASTALPANEFTPPTDKMFKGWSLTANGAILTSPYTFTGNTELFAIWKDAPNIAIGFDNNGGEGTMSPIITKQNQPITLPENEFTAPAGKEFIGWLDSATPHIINGAYLVILPGKITDGLNADGTIYAIWAERPADYFKLTITMVGGDNTSSIIFAPKGTDFDLSSYMSDEDEQFYISTDSTGTNRITSLVNPQADTTVYLFEHKTPPVSYSVTVTNGTANHSSATSDTSITLTANIPPLGQQFKEWTITGVTVSDYTLNPLTFNMPANPVTATATYEAVSLATDAVTTFDIDYADLDKVILRINSTDYELTRHSDKQLSGYTPYTFNGGKLGKEASGSVVITLYKEFLATLPSGTTYSTEVATTGGTTAGTTTATIPTKNNYDLTINANGATGTTASGTYEEGTIIDITAGTRSGYTFNGWSGSGVTFTNANSATTQMQMPSADTTITANWTKNSTSGTGSGGGSSTTYYDIEIEVEGIGEVNPDGGSDDVERVAKNSDKKFTFTADEGYMIADVLIDGKSMGDIKSYTFEEVKEDHTLKVVFEMKDDDTGSGTATKNPFMDIKSSEWFYEAVMYVYEEGIMSGVTNNTFAPTDNATRAMIWTVLARLSGADLAMTEMWYESAQEWSIENEVSDGTNPNGYITREQLVTMLFRYNNDPAMTLQTMLEQFEDGDMVSEYAVSAMEWAVAKGIINGKGEMLDPQGNATRAEIAAIMHRFMTME